MLGVISSTIYPSDEPMYWGSPRSCIPSEERLEQTQKTVASLARAGITEIVLADNSGDRWRAGTEECLKPAKVYVYNQHQFRNKGISEIYLLLNVLPHLSSGTPILKISGRYYLNKTIHYDIGEADIAGKFTEDSRSRLMMSTRCYMVRSREIYENILRGALRELYGYSARIVGPRSFLRIVRNSIFPEKDVFPYDDPGRGIEIALARVVTNHRYRVKKIQDLGIEGISGDIGKLLIRE